MLCRRGRAGIAAAADLSENILMSKPSFYARIGRLSSIILFLPSCMAVGWLLGYYLIDRYFPTYPWGSIGLTMVGAGAGLYEIFRILVRDAKDGK